MKNLAVFRHRFVIRIFSCLRSRCICARNATTKLFNNDRSGKVDQTPPFDKPGLVKTGDNEYQLNIVASAFAYTPNQVEIPKGAKVTINVATKDVIHGFQIVGTNVNMMVEPGYVSSYTQTFDKVGEYVILCNEYCGAGHHLMTSKVKVVEQ